MNLNSIEILATILIAVGVIKIIIFLINPKIWFNFIEKIYSAPLLVSIMGLIASLVVLYFLISSGITITEILAVSLFVVLLILTGIANYADEIIAWINGQDFIFMMKRLWLYSMVWLLLITWGINEIFF